MFPTFISILDIQSWWELPSIAHFCSLFRTAFNLLDFDIEDLEEALLTDGTEEPSWLQDLIVRLLTGCLPNNEISTFNYQMFLRRLFRVKCKEHDRYNPFNTDTDFQLLPLRTKVDIIHALCDFRLDADDVLEQLKNLEADSLRVEPLGYDNNNSAFWYFYGTRLYREDFKTKNNKKLKSVWQVVCFTQEDWFQLAKKFKKSESKVERHLYRTLTENFLPELPRLFHEKEHLARKRLLENLPRRTSSRLVTKKKQDEVQIPKEIPVKTEVDHEVLKKQLEQRRQEAYDRRNRLRAQSENDSDLSKHSNEMAGTRKRGRPKINAPISTTSGSSRRRGRPRRKDSSKSVGRQTNNSLSSATGKILIEPMLNPHRKKLKTSQVFGQTEEDLQTGMHKVLDFVMNHDDSWPFIEPVEEEHAPNYYSVIRKPMDLQRMEERLDSGYYQSYTKFRGDFQLIVDNCRLYNGVDNEYTDMAFSLLTVFDKATERYLDETTSTDEDITVEYNTAKRDKLSVLSPRKPTLAAQTDEKTVFSDDSSKLRKTDDGKRYNKVVKTKKKVGRKPKRKEPSPVRSRSRSRSRSFSKDRFSSSPPPSWPPSSPESVILEQRKTYLNDADDVLNKGKEKSTDKWNTLMNDEKKDGEKLKEPLILPKHKVKNKRLRETIEKLRTNSNVASKFVDLEENFDHKRKNEFKYRKKRKTDSGECDANSTDSVHSTDNSKFTHKRNSDIEALTLATEQTLKDINKWLDATPRLPEYSSASNSPSRYLPVEELDASKLEKRVDKPVLLNNIKKEAIVKEVKRRTFHHHAPKDPTKFIKKREVQRTIDRLQPGKSKGNLISNVPQQNANKPEELLPLSKIKDTKNVLVVKADEATPKLSLGSVLNSFGKHKFVDEASAGKKLEIVVSTNDEKTEIPVVTPGKATPNLSAWFKAFGAPKTTTVSKKVEVKEAPEVKVDEVKTVAQPEASPNIDLGVPQTTPRQRKMSTGSTVSEQSSFSQDMDSPRIGTDERLYPAPYPSPLHRSPSGASPIMASSRPDVSPKSPFPTVNGQIRVGFYQDTASTKSSPDKSCSPRENPPYPQYTEPQHVYAPVTSENVTYTYSGNNYYYTNSAGITEQNYDTNKSLTDQYQAQAQVKPPSSSYQEYQAVNSPAPVYQAPPGTPTPANYESFRQPVKKRYNEADMIQYDINSVPPNSTERPQYVHQNIPNPRSVSVMNTQPPYPNTYNNYNSEAYQLMQRKLDLTLAHDPNTKNLDMSKYTNMGYTGPETTFPPRNQQTPQYNYEKGPETSVYNQPPKTPLIVDQQTLALQHSTLTNLDRFTPAENMYYSNKPIFNQPNYNDQFIQNQPPPQQVQQTSEKKPKRRKNAKVDTTTSETTTSTNQGFQSYAGLKEPSAISLKTSSVVPGSAFNFGTGLYGDTNFLEDYRSAPNYYMAAAAAAAHHRATPEVGSDKQINPFMGGPQSRPPTYPFMAAPHQGPPLMDPSSPLYQQYLQAGVLHQGLLGPHGAYPHGYHPAISMRQQFDSMTRPSWL